MTTESVVSRVHHVNTCFRKINLRSFVRRETIEPLLFARKLFYAYKYSFAPTSLRFLRFQFPFYIVPAPVPWDLIALVARTRSWSPLRAITLHLHAMHRENWLLRSQFDLDFHRLRIKKHCLRDPFHIDISTSFNSNSATEHMIWNFILS